MASPVIFSVNAQDPDPALIAQAARLVVGGGLVAFPTETVYGLAADASNPKAIERLNRVKGRPPEKPYSIHLCRASQVEQWVREVPPLAKRLMQQFWPGPLTIVMPTGTGESVGFRLPNHPVAQAFLCQCHRPVVAPSANRSGSPPPTDGREVVTALGDAIDGLVDAGPTPMGRESTVVSIVGEALAIVREGAIPEAALRAAVV